METKQKHTNLDWQFVVILENLDGQNLDCRWAGVEFDNSWEAACLFAKEWVTSLAAKGEILQARVNDRMKRKEDVVIKHEQSSEGILSERNELKELNKELLKQLSETSAQRDRLKEDLQMICNYVSMREFDINVLRSMVEQSKIDHKL